jgi:hypothetical protein
MVSIFERYPEKRAVRRLLYENHVSHCPASSYFGLERIDMRRIALGRKTVVIGMAVGVGILHFFTGPEYRGPLRTFVTGHLINILLPFTIYLVLGITRHAALRSEIVRCALVFGIGAVTETLQYAGLPIFGRTFDPLDYLMFGIGILSAAVFEWAVLSRLEERPQ